jgi:hypothetical protein
LTRPVDTRRIGREPRGGFGDYREVLAGIGDPRIKAVLEVGHFQVAVELELETRDTDPQRTLRCLREAVQYLRTRLRRGDARCFTQPEETP